MSNPHFIVRAPRVAVPCLLILVAGLMPGCLDERRTGRGSASSAMRTSRDGGGVIADEPTRDYTHHHEHSDHELAVCPEPFAGSGKSTKPTIAASGFSAAGDNRGFTVDRGEQFVALSAGGGYTVLFSGGIGEITEYGARLHIGVSDTGEVTAGIFAGGATTRDATLFGQAVTDVVVVRGEIGYRYHPFATFVSPYVGGGLSFGAAFWEYRNPVVSQGETRHGDGADFVDFNLAVGVTIGYRERVFLDLTATPLVRLYSSTTFDDFDNDLGLNSFGISFTATVGISF